MYFILLFTALSLVNVILNTFKTIITAKGNKLGAVIINAITYGFYTIVVIYTADESFSLWQKIVITMATNAIGVWITMEIMERLRKDKLWEIVATISKENTYKVEQELKNANIEFSWNCLDYDDNKSAFHIYSYSQKESVIVKPILKKYNAKYIVHEESVKL